MRTVKTAVEVAVVDFRAMSAFLAARRSVSDKSGGRCISCDDDKWTQIQKTHDDEYPHMKHHNNYFYGLLLLAIPSHWGMCLIY
jgi:hypothetical protein